MRQAVAETDRKVCARIEAVLDNRQRSWRKALKNRFASSLARVGRRPRLSAAELKALRPGRILIVRQHNQMGDMICATPALRAVRETFAGADVALVTSPVNHQVVQHNPDLTRVFTFAQKLWRRPWALWRFVRELRGWRPELAFVLSSVSFSLTSAAIALFSGARYVVGPDSEPFGWDFSSKAFSLTMPAMPQLDRPAVEHGLAPLAAIGIVTEDTDPVMVPAPTEVEQARRIMADLSLEPGFWALHPGAGKMQNVWPAERFTEVIRRAVAAGHRILVLHGPADAGSVRGVKAGLGDLAGESVRIAPNMTVGVAAALLQQADRFLCNDTGVMHVAGALHVPTLALFGPTDPALWKPPSAAVEVMRSPGRDPDERGQEYGWMEQIDVESVWRRWRELPGRDRRAEDR